MATYDSIWLAPDEWGNDTMDQVAREYFAAHTGVHFVLVIEHAGWHLGYRRDGSKWATANDAADLKPGPRPTAFSGTEVRRTSQAARL